MLQFDNLSKQYGGKILFGDLTFRVGDRNRVALVGPNGAGKSTLMKIIAGLEDADSGSVNLTRAETVGYLPQDGVYHQGRTLLEEVSSVFAELDELEKKASDLGREIAAQNGPAGSAAAARKMRELGDIQNLLEHRGAYHLDTKIKMILSGLGFREGDLSRQVEAFSGGWHMRIELGKILLLEPTVLLLDEPTNHLDMDSLQWLESYLTSYKGSIIAVSHDSRFLDNLVDGVLEISSGTATSYTGNYTSFLRQRALRAQQAEAAREKQEAFIEQSLRFIERFRYKNTKAKQVQSRIRMLKKLDIVETAAKERRIAFRFPEAPRAGRIVLTLSDVAKRYGTLEVFSRLSLQIGRTDRVAVLGVNGSGKSTLARIIAGTDAYQEGSRLPGHGAAVGYFSQDLSELLDPIKTVYETVLETDPSRTQTELRTLLGSFLFTGDDVLKPVSVLSGGEKSRLALAKMLLTPANLLVLDEPTNHLDIPSKALLQERLLAFPGAFVIVSHDRDFLIPLIERVLEIRDGVLEDFRGSLEEYLEKRKESGGPVPPAEPETPQRTEVVTEKERKRLEAEKRQRLSRKLQPLREALKKVEAEIRDGEETRASLESALAEAPSSRGGRDIQELHRDYHRNVSRLEELYDQWMVLEEEIERVSVLAE